MCSRHLLWTCRRAFFVPMLWLRVTGEEVLFFCCFLLWYMCAEQGRERVLAERGTHVSDVRERRKLSRNISERCIILYHRGGTALLLIQSLWKNIYITVFIRAARRFYASFKKGRDTQTAVRTKQVKICLFFFSTPLTTSMMMQRFSSHHIKNSSLWKCLSKVCEGVTFPNELKRLFLLLLTEVAS